MTADMTLGALKEKSPDASFLREMIGYGAQRLMELEVGGLTGAPHGEKSAERLYQTQPDLNAGLFVFDELEAQVHPLDRAC